MNSFPILSNRTFVVRIADNAASGVHRAGYNGVASLIPLALGNNVFVPHYSGMNYESIFLDGLPDYETPGGGRFEPRCEPMFIKRAEPRSVLLEQPATANAGVAARIEFCVEEPHYLHQRIELTFHRRFRPDGEPCWFRSLWANYIHMPRDLHMYLKPDWRTGPDLAGWLGISREDHRSGTQEARRLPHDREIGAAEHLDCMKSVAPMAGESWTRLIQEQLAPMWLPSGLDVPCAFFHGFCAPDWLFLTMFRQPERVRLAYSPRGGGREPSWCPAWDYVLRLDDVTPLSTHVWDVCLVVKPYRGRADILGEVRRFQSR